MVGFHFDVTILHNSGIMFNYFAYVYREDSGRCGIQWRSIEQ
jgi:hypothetical protein